VFGKHVTEVSFDTAQPARCVKFVLRQEKGTRWLSIDEINVVQQRGAPGRPRSAIVGCMVTGRDGH
jgi:hypothetical protein